MRAPLAAAIALVAAAPSAAIAVEPPLTSTRLLTGLSKPLQVTYAPGDFTRLFVVEQGGRIKIHTLGSSGTLPTPFLDITSITLAPSSYLEYGLLGLAFDPDYQTNGYFYVIYTPGTANLADWVLARYRVSAANPNQADAASGQVLLRINYPGRKQHRSGFIGFKPGDPDKYLYCSTGDGGENDPDNAASVTSNTMLGLRGKILRLDVRGPDGLPGTADDDGFPDDAMKNYRIPTTNPWAGQENNAQEIWAYGLRNPWRCAFDRLTGDLWIGDVGQLQREEVNVIPATGPRAVAAAPIFFGWRCKEGTLTTSLSCLPGLPTPVDPVYEYPRSQGISVTGGHVYRGCSIPGLHGAYFFGDWNAGRLWTIRYDPATGAAGSFTDRTAEVATGGVTAWGGLTSFGEDAFGELYWVRGGAGEVWKLLPRTPQGTDCNANGQPDGCDLLAGILHDANGNGLPDECEPPACLADVGSTGGAPGPDGTLDNNDFIVFIDLFFDASPAADLGATGGIRGSDGLWNNNDFVVFIDLFFTGC